MTRQPGGWTSAGAAQPLGALGPLLLAVLAAAAGCAAQPLRFPAQPNAVSPTGAGRIESYDTDGNGKPDYFAAMNDKGRIVRIAYDTSGDGLPDTDIPLAGVNPDQCREVVIILDGVPFDLVEECYKAGLLRLFHPPVRVIAPFPSVTDPSLADVFSTEPTTGFEAQFFDHKENRLGGGDAFYLATKNEPWAPCLDYRAGTMLDALGYLQADWAFNKEVAEFEKLFQKTEGRDLTVYFVSTAGIGSREGAEGLRRVLQECDRLAKQLVWQTRGRVKITMLADHGHTLERCERIDFRKMIQERGWHVADRLDGARDVVPIEYGLLTYASFATLSKDALADDLLRHQGVAFVTYIQGQSVIVRTRDGIAFIEQRGNRYRYRAMKGDPLDLQPIMNRLGAAGKLDRGGFADDADWFALTTVHTYPDALDRLWRAFHGLTENTPDVIASLGAGYCAGAASKRAWLPYMASTHGDLGRSSSTTFIMSTVGPMTGAPGRPPAWRSRQVAELLTQAFGHPWPSRAAKETEAAAPPR